MRQDIGDNTTVTVTLEKTPVAWLERCYDLWVMEETEQPAIDGVVVWVANRWELPDRPPVGPGHMQPWIVIKNDMAGTENEALWRRRYNCNSCADDSHRCFECNAPTTHMADSVCPPCADGRLMRRLY